MLPRSEETGASRLWRLCHWPRSALGVSRSTEGIDRCHTLPALAGGVQRKNWSRAELRASAGGH